ncbi:MAG: SH3 domain-containing protein [Pseudomonadales bacterium]
MLQKISIAIIVLTNVLCFHAKAQDLEFRVNVSYIDMHTGPGRGFPKFYSIAQGEALVVLKQRTSWIKVETTKGRRGWIKAHDLEHTVTLDGRAVRLP